MFVKLSQCCLERARSRSLRGEAFQPSATRCKHLCFLLCRDIALLHAQTVPHLLPLGQKGPTFISSDYQHNHQHKLVLSFHLCLFHHLQLVNHPKSTSTLFVHTMSMTDSSSDSSTTTEAATEAATCREAHVVLVLHIVGRHIVCTRIHNPASAGAAKEHQALFRGAEDVMAS